MLRKPHSNQNSFQWARACLISKLKPNTHHLHFKILAYWCVCQSLSFTYLANHTYLLPILPFCYRYQSAWKRLAYSLRECVISVSSFNAFLLDLTCFHIISLSEVMHGSGAWHSPDEKKKNTNHNVHLSYKCTNRAKVSSWYLSPRQVLFFFFFFYVDGTNWAGAGIMVHESCLRSCLTMSLICIPWSIKFPYLLGFIMRPFIPYTFKAQWFSHQKWKH